MIYKLEEIKSVFDKVVIPSSVKRKRTFLDISGFPYYEMVISNWYAYFLRHDEEHALGNLFLDSLLVLVRNKSKRHFDIKTFVVETETATERKKRIDILIRGVDNDEGKYLIVENKIYHYLNNDLSEYWSYCKTTDERKIGVVLSLQPKPVPDSTNGKYVNILHSELIHQVRISLLKSEGTEYLSDFLNAIDNLYNDEIMDEQVLFYYNNLELCNRVYDITDRVYKFVTDHISIAAQHLGLQYGGARAEYYRFMYLPNQDGVYYTIVFSGLFEKPAGIYIIIELWGKGLSLVSEIDVHCADRIKSKTKLVYKPKEEKGKYMHYAAKYYNLEMDGIHNLSEVIAKWISEDFSSTMNDVVAIINQHIRKIS